MNPLLRNESGFATVAGLICTAAGIKGRNGSVLTAADFNPYARDDDPERVATVDDLKQMFKVPD